MPLKYRVIRDHTADAVSVPLGTILYPGVDSDCAKDEMRFNKKLFGLELDLVAVSFEERGVPFFTFHRASLEPIE